MTTNSPKSPAADLPPAAPVKSLEELIAEQGVRPLVRFADLFGAGGDLWTDEEFGAFLEQLQATRREKDGITTPTDFIGC